jgi:hypothetical protein
MALSHVALDGLDAEGAPVAHTEVVDDARHVDIDSGSGRAVAEERLDAIDLPRVQGVPGLSSRRLAHDDAVGSQHLHVVAHGRLTKPERVGEPTDEGASVR